VFHPPDCQCSHLGPLALFCTADTLLIASCLFWSENWLLAYFLPPHQDCHVADKKKAAVKNAAVVSGGKDESQV